MSLEERMAFSASGRISKQPLNQRKQWTLIQPGNSHLFKFVKVKLCTFLGRCNGCAHGCIQLKNWISFHRDEEQ